MSSSVSDQNLEKKFKSVTNTQDSIQTLSLWLLHHKAHHKKIVAAWMKVLKTAKITHRLTLFYLANDVIQNGKRKGNLDFGNSFAETLREATLLVRDEQIRPSIQRVFNIWLERGIYTPEFITDLRAILVNTKVPATAHSKLLAEFKPDLVIEKLRLVMKLEMEAASKMSALNLSKLNATNAEIVQQLKDRTHGQQFKREFDESARLLEEIIKLCNKEIKERTELILLLEQSEIYYDTQRGEARIVSTAYKNFSSRVKALQKNLEELKATFPSPLPSPCPDAPSPTSSDHENELSLPNDQAQTNELENLENAPSPVGTPEGLNLSPEKVVETEALPVSTQTVGNPIPTLSNFFSNGQSGMSSWLDTFSNKKSLNATTEKTKEVSKTDSSSLDSRLSNLLQNIPNLPSGLQSTIFGSTSSGNNTPLRDSVNSPLSTKKDIESTTPIKDEYSGQNTPLQDEESTSSHTFFQKLTSNNKPKDILKNLTSLIQSASGDKSADESQKKEKYSYGSTDSFSQGGGVSSFIKQIIPSVQVTQSPSFFNSTQSALSTPVQTVSVLQPSPITTYESTSLQDVPAYSSKPISERTENLSFIPTLVPSMPQDDYNYSSYSTNEYNPELETFDSDMECENPIDDDLDEHSPPIDDLSPVPSEDIDQIMPRPVGGRRLSTLITVVTKDSPENSLPSTELPTEDVYKSDEKVSQDPGWISNIPAKVSDPWNKSEVVPVPVAEPVGNSSPNEEFFIGKDTAALQPVFYTSVPPPPPPPPPPPAAPPNGQTTNYIDSVNIPVTAPTNIPLSKIETVHTQRDGMNGRWQNNNWIENDRRPIPQIPPPGPPPMPGNFQEPHFFDKRNFHPQRFPPRNNWIPRPHRLDRPFHRPYAPPHQNKRFPFRGRGRGRGHYPQY